MIPYPGGHRAAFALTSALVLSTSACRDASPAPDKRAESVPTPTSAAPPEPSVDCDALLTPAEIKEACGFEASAPADQPTDDIGEGRTCSRRWASKEDGGALRMRIVRHASAGEAKERFEIKGEVIADMPGYKALTGLGDMARRYIKRRWGGYDDLSVECVKGRFDVLVLSVEDHGGPLAMGPSCSIDQLEKIAAKVVAKLP